LFAHGSLSFSIIAAGGPALNDSRHTDATVVPIIAGKSYVFVLQTQYLKDPDPARDPE